MIPSPARVAARWLAAAAFKPEDLPEDTLVTVDISSNEIRALFSDEDGDDMGGSINGVVEVYGPGSDTGPCLNAFVVARAFVDSGWGPLLYDVAMEAAGKRGLTPDRERLSADAERVWRYYMTRRSDVMVKQLDFPPKSETHLTPDSKDDCEMKARPVRTEEDLLGSPLAKVYYAKGKPTMRALAKARKLLRL